MVEFVPDDAESSQTASDEPLIATLRVERRESTGRMKLVAGGTYAGFFQELAAEHELRKAQRCRVRTPPPIWTGAPQPGWAAAAAAADQAQMQPARKDAQEEFGRPTLTPEPVEPRQGRASLFADVQDKPVTRPSGRRRASQFRRRASSAGSGLSSSNMARRRMSRLPTLEMSMGKGSK